ncbi:MAG TPA: hypothetical protein PKX23_02895 [Verrucomicrobiota bacterium]|jgi:hypothetical protein|nr:hypothetical protein [Verrucomicrobiota bacterium]
MKTGFLVLVSLVGFLVPAGQAAQTAQGRMYCLSIRLGQGINWWSDTISFSSTGMTDGAGELLSWQTPGSDILFPPNETYITGLALYDSLWDETYYGTLSVLLPPLVDADGNRFPDFFEVARPVSGAVSSGSYSTGIYGPHGAVSALWNRNAGAPTGTFIFSLEYYGEFYGYFDILEYTGPVEYTPGSNSISASVHLTQTGDPAKTFRGPLVFPKGGADRFNQFTNQPAIWTNAALEFLQVTNHLFLRETAWPTNYAGYIEFDNDGDQNSLYPWALWVLSITDTHDANANGIPDFSDDPAAPPPPRRPSLSLRHTGTNLVLTIAGDPGHVHEVLAAPTLTGSPWLSVTSLNLVTDPQSLALPLPSAPAFWRVRAQ